MAAERDFYVYILYRADGVTPFYVGKGRGKRWLNHERDAKRKSSHSHKIAIIKQIQALGLDVPKRKVAENLSNSEACTLEIKLIDKFGRGRKGLLTNISAGGDSTKGMLGRRHGSKTKRQMSEAAKGRVISIEQRQMVSRFHTGRQQSVEERAKRSAAQRRRWSSVNARRQQSARMVLVRADPKHTAKWGSLNGYVHSKKAKATYSKVAQRRCKTVAGRRQLELARASIGGHLGRGA